MTWSPSARRSTPSTAGRSCSTPGFATPSSEDGLTRHPRRSRTSAARVRPGRWARIRISVSGDVPVEQLTLTVSGDRWVELDAHAQPGRRASGRRRAVRPARRAPGRRARPQHQLRRCHDRTRGQRACSRPPTARSLTLWQDEPFGWLVTFTPRDFPGAGGPRSRDRARADDRAGGRAQHRRGTPLARAGRALGRIVGRPLPRRSLTTP